MLAVADQKMIAEQMGRTPQGVVAVAARCSPGHPAVIACYPLRREQGRAVPFPTLYWLTCPQLSAQVSHLERDGVIALLEAEIASDPSLRAALARDHERYQSQRWATLTKEDQQLLSSEPSPRNTLDHFRGRGIGGMTSRTSIKCLHLHLAHHLADGNVIGELLMHRFGVKPCPVSPLTAQAPPPSVS